MPNNTLYVIDTSSLIDFNRHYNHPVFRSLNDDFERLIKDGRMTAPHQVLGEIRDKDDLCTEWAEPRAETLFKNNYSPYIFERVAEIMVDFRGLIDIEGEEDKADPWIIAMAHEVKYGPQERFVDYDDVCVVTQERLHGNRIKIPYVCQQLDISCCPLLEMFTLEGWQY